MSDYAAYKMAADKIQELEQQYAVLSERYGKLDAQYHALREFITAIVDATRVGAEGSEDIRFLMLAINALGDIYNKKLAEIESVKLTA